MEGLFFPIPKGFSRNHVPERIFSLGSISDILFNKIAAGLLERNEFWISSFPLSSLSLVSFLCIPGELFTSR